MRAFRMQFGAELRKLFARKRTYIGFGAFLLLEVLFVIFLNLKGQRGIRRLIENQGQMFESYYSAATVGFLVTGMSIILLGALFLALVGGDIVSKESEDGTLRMMLSRPVSRFRVLLVKYLSAMVYTFVLIAFLTVSAWLMGLVLCGWKEGFFVYTMSPPILAFYRGEEALVRYFGSIPLLGFAMCTVTSLAFFFSCLRIKPAAATILTIGYLFIDFILHKSPFLVDSKHWFLCDHLDQWARWLAPVVAWPTIIKEFAILAGINVTLFLAGWVVFQLRDFKS